jgi:hypothetical protein
MPAALAGLAALVLAAPAASSPSVATAPHANRVAATGPHLIHIHPGLVKDCEYIELYANGSNTGLYIAGNGKNKAVTLKSKTSASCFDLVHEFTYQDYLDPVNGKYETSDGWQYQADGQCLWQNDTSYELELGVACNSSDTSEDFFGLYDSDSVYGGWLVSDVYEGPDLSMGITNASCPASGENVYVKNVGYEYCSLWNFPS